MITWIREAHGALVAPRHFDWSESCMPFEGDITQLLRRVGDGDEGAMAELYPLVERVFRAMAKKRKLRRGPAAEEVPTTLLIDEAFLQNVVPGSGSWDKDGRRIFYDFATRTMEDKLIAEYRKRKRRDSLLPQVPLDDADDVGLLRRRLDDVDFRIDLKGKLAELQMRGKNESMGAVVFRMKWFLGCKLTEVSEVLGVDYKTVVKQYAVALTWVRLNLKGYTDAGR
jgi:DNA-directed RNA polymerase specialized sigma24 family protein